MKLPDNLVFILNHTVSVLVVVGWGIYLITERNWWALLLLVAFFWLLHEHNRYRDFMARYADFYRGLEDFHSNEMFKLSKAMYRFSTYNPEDYYCICGQEKHTEKCELFRKTLHEHSSTLDKINQYLKEHTL
jgi:hypothetical protein